MITPYRFTATAGAITGGQIYGAFLAGIPEWQEDVLSSQDYVPVACTLRNILFRVSVPPGLGNSISYTLEVNGSNTAATWTISNTDQDAEYLPDISLDAGDLVRLVITGTTGTPATQDGIRYAFEIETAGNLSLYWSAALIVNSLGPRFHGIFNAGADFTASGALAAVSPSPISGTLIGYAMRANRATGTNIDFAIYEATTGGSGVRQDGSGATVDTTHNVTGAAGTELFIESFSLPVVEGREYYLRSDRTGGSMGAGAAGFFSLCFLFEADVEGESVLSATWTQVMASTDAARYQTPSVGDQLGWDSLVADVQALWNVTSVRFDKMYIRLGTAPGSGNTRTFQPVTNGSGAGPTVTISGTDITGNETATAFYVEENEWFAFEVVGTSTPDSGYCAYSMRQFIASPLMRVTQHVVEVICDEDADDDPPEDVVACTGGGLVDEGVNPDAEVSLATTTAPLCWMEVTLQGESPQTVYRWAKMPIPHGEPKEARVLEFGTVTLALSDIDGGPETATITTRLQDVDGDIRALWASEALLQSRVDYYIADLATVIAELTPSRRFRGYISKCEPDGDRTFLITVEDALSSRLNAIDGQDLQSPTQLVEDNLGTLAADAEMYDKPAPLIFGEVASETGAWPLKYVGSYVAPGYESLGALAWFLVSMGVVKVPDAWIGGLGPLPTSRIKLTETQFTAGLLYAPGHGGWIEANDWSERIDRRWTLVAGKPNGVAIKLAIEGTIPILVNVCGLQSDQSLGSPHATVDSPARALLLYLNNYLAQDALTDFLPILEDDGVSIFDTDTFEAVHDALEAMIGSGGSSAIAGAIGADYQQVSWRDRIAEFCRSFGYQFGVNRHGQGVLTVLDLTSGASGFAFTTRHVLDKSVRFPSRLPVENVIRFVHTQLYAKPLTAITPPVSSRLPVDPYAADWESGLQTVSDTASIDALGGGTRGTRRSEVQEYSLSRDSVQSEEVATRRLNLLSPPNGRIEVTFAVTLRHGWDLRLGQVGTVEHWDMPWTGARRCQIQRLEENLDEFTISPTLRDVDDLLP